MFEYATAEAQVPDEIKEAHRQIWEHIVAAGTWWNGTQRVAMVAEARLADSCNFCRQRKQTLSAASIKGEHTNTGVLPAAAVEVVHRVRTDPARLSRAWFDSLVPDQLSAPQYVELVGVCALVSGVDFFARSLGVELEDLPTPRDGEPSRHLPQGLQPGIAWVPLLAPEDASGPEAGLYGDAPIVPNIMRALSSVPAQVHALRHCIEPHYVPLARLQDPSAQRAIDRLQIELVAARVSALNQCFY